MIANRAIAAAQRAARAPADIMIVNWNGRAFMERFLPLVLELTPPRHRILVWDNGSQDGSQDFLSGLGHAFRGRVVPYYSYRNIGHDSALRQLLGRTRAQRIVFLDCDATPLRAGWLEELSRPLADGAIASGIEVWRQRPRTRGPLKSFVHPACLVTAREVLRLLGVIVEAKPPEWDVLEHLAIRAEEYRLRLAGVPEDGEFMFNRHFGQTYGNLIYHHWFGTRVNPWSKMEVTPEGRSRQGLQMSLLLLDDWLLGLGLHRTAPPARPGLHLRARARALLPCTESTLSMLTARITRRLTRAREL